MKTTCATTSIVPAASTILKGGRRRERQADGVEEPLRHLRRDGRERLRQLGEHRGDQFPARFVPNFDFGDSKIPLGVPTGALRAPGSNAFSFVFQSFIDELAYAAGKDPVQFRLDLLAQPAAARRPARRLTASTPQRMTAVVKLKWRRSRAGGASCRPAPAWASASSTATAATSPKSRKSRVDSQKRVKVNKVWVVGDIGSQIINPLHAENLVQGGVIEALTPPDGQETTFQNGRAVESNYNTQPLVRMSQAPPEIDAFFLKTNNPPTGLGEPSLPPLIPAVTNAIYAANKDRVRALPLDKSGYRWA